MTYQIWAFVAGGAKAAVLENAFGIERTEKENCAPTLKFSLPANDAKAIYLTKAYEVKVWNTIKSRFEGIYILDDATDKWSLSGSTIECNYSGAISQLVAEDNISYDTTSTPKTPTQIATALLALQTNTTTPITVGTIQPTTTFAIAVENTNIFKALLEAVSYLGGRIEVDDTRALNWYTEPSTATPTREIRYQKNMIGVTRKRDYTSITNRLYAYGYGETEAQLTLIDAGQTHEYIEDATSQVAYGIQIKRITDKRITHPATLLLWAQKVLAQYKDPLFSYQVDVANLAVHPDFSFDLEDLEVGQVVRVINSDISMNVNVKIVTVTTDLSDARKITVELANATKTLADSLAAAADTSSVVNNIAVQIGAGQVTVQGTFTVDGWRTTGKTTIDGGNITANTITVSQLNFTPVQGSDVIASINASSEGIAISASKITISGSCVFASGYDPSGKIAYGNAAADVNANVTTINGGKITANSITAAQIAANTITTAQLNFTPVQGGNVIASINASSEGITISANKITISGLCTFASGYDPSGKIATGAAAADVNANATTINGGKITTNTLDADAIKTSTLNAKTITLGTTGGDAIIKSGNYSAGSAGWQIKANGDAEFNNVTVRGTMKTCTLDAGSTLTVSGVMKSANFDSNAPYNGWSLDGQGGAVFKAVHVRGSINVDGDVSAIGGVSTQKQLSLIGNISDANAPTRSLYTNDGKNLLWKKSDGTIRTIVTS